MLEIITYLLMEAPVITIFVIKAKLYVTVPLVLCWLAAQIYLGIKERALMRAYNADPLARVLHTLLLISIFLLRYGRPHGPYVNETGIRAAGIARITMLIFPMASLALLLYKKKTLKDKDGDAS